MPNSFVWYELMTTDLEAATAFYTSVVGWSGRQADQTDKPYTLMLAGDANAAGLMLLPEEVERQGGRPVWLGYVGVADIDAAAARFTAAGGTVHRAPEPIPGVGRFAPVSDPQGAMLMLFEPAPGDYPPEPPPLTPGHIGWRELYAADWTGAFDFYAGQFGWTKGEALDMGPMGKYQLFAAGGADIGGMMDKPAAIPRPHWGYYFNVDAIDAAASRVTAAGGSIVMGPHEVPGGTWVLQCIDPQGASFALTAARR